MARSRLIGAYPVIGIRPTIDGRRGPLKVREGLEEQTMNMARGGKDGSPFKSAYEVMANWGANHGAISYGHIGADLITLCSMLRIPVCMHNVPEEKIFRPAAWNAFGMDKEGADYRACASFGPMFKK